MHLKFFAKILPRLYGAYARHPEIAQNVRNFSKLLTGLELCMLFPLRFTVQVLPFASEYVPLTAGRTPRCRYTERHYLFQT